MVNLARTSAKRIPGMAADLWIGHARVDGCGRYSDTSFRCAGRVRCSACFGPSVRILRFAISLANVQPIDWDLEIVGERAEQVALLGVRVTV